MKYVLVCCFIIGIGCAAHGQTHLMGSATLKDSTSMTTIPVLVSAGTAQINCLFNGSLNRGTLSINFKDPEGRLQAGFSLDANDKNGAKGGSRQEFKNPFPGKWRLEIELRDATGKLSYQLDVKP